MQNEFVSWISRQNWTFWSHFLNMKGKFWAIFRYFLVTILGLQTFWTIITLDLA